jgi:ABC-type multidrug transport system fused ATPase/permease subunit
MSEAQSKTSAVAQPRRPLLASLAALYGTTSWRLRILIGMTTAISAAGKILAVIVAERILGGDVRGTMVMGILGAVVFAAARVLSSGTRVDAQCDLQAAMARAIVESDVLTEPTPHPMRSLYEPAYNARALMTDTVPELLASSTAAIAVAPIVAATLPARVLGVSGIGLVVVMAALLALGRASAAVQRRVWEASQEVLDQVALTVEGRLEIVARGADAAAMRSVERAFERYRTTAKRGAWAAAMLGRAPLAAGLAAIGLTVVLDASYREAVTVAVLKQALVVIACFPILLGVVTLASQLVRLSTTIGPVLDVLGAPARPELTRVGKTPPELPATIRVRDITFAYEPGSPPTLGGLSFEWPAGGALLIDGPNGAGKSTLLRVLLGLRSPQQGAVSVGDADLASVDLQAFRRRIAYLPQRSYLGEVDATVRSALRGVDDEVTDDAMTAVLDRVRLMRSAPRAAILDTTIGELSAGERQRLAFARVLLQDAAIYVLDEPDANLDRAGIVLVGEIVRELVGRGRMVAIAAHTEELSSLPGVRVTLGEANTGKSAPAQ